MGANNRKFKSGLGLGAVLILGGFISLVLYSTNAVVTTSIATGLISSGATIIALAIWQQFFGPVS